MTLLHLHRDDTTAFAGNGEALMPRIFRRLGLPFRLLHQAILRARLRRLHGEWLFRPDYGDLMPPEQDLTKLPQRPLVLGDKWDF